MGRNVIELTPRKILGYVLLTVGISFSVILIIGVILLATGMLTPIKIPVPNQSSGIDVFAGLALEIGLLAILSAVAFGMCKIGVELSGD